MTIKLEDLNNIFLELFNRSDMSIKRETTAKDIEGWDSLMHVRIIISIEQNYNISFSASEATSFDNVGDILDLINSKI